MSGGHYDSLDCNIDELADRIERALTGRIARDAAELTPEQIDARIRFVAHLRLVSVAARAIDFVDSGDSANADELEPIKLCLAGSTISLKVREMIFRAAATANDRLTSVAKGEYRPVINVVTPCDPMPKMRRD